MNYWKNKMKNQISATVQRTPSGSIDRQETINEFSKNLDTFVSSFNSNDSKILDSLNRIFDNGLKEGKRLSAIYIIHEVMKEISGGYNASIERKTRELLKNKVLFTPVKGIYSHVFRTKDKEAITALFAKKN